jgi:hypothetical protein
MCLISTLFVRKHVLNFDFQDHMESICKIAFDDGVSPQIMKDGVVTFLLLVDQQYSSTKLEVYTPGGTMNVPLKDFSKTIYRKASITVVL